MIEKKGVQVLLKAAAKLTPKQNYKIHIVGDGPYKKELQKQTKKLGIESIVSFWGNQRDIVERLTNADIFVHPAIWEEGFGISIIEAMSCGKICIAWYGMTYHEDVAAVKGSFKEMLENGVYKADLFSDL